MEGYFVTQLHPSFFNVMRLNKTPLKLLKGYFQHYRHLILLLVITFSHVISS